MGFPASIAKTLGFAKAHEGICKRKMVKKVSSGAPTKDSGVPKGLFLFLYLNFSALLHFYNIFDTIPIIKASEISQIPLVGVIRQEARPCRH